jgi:hypothetical protein
MAALALWSVSHGSSWEATLAAGGLRLSRELGFPATRRELRPKRLELV